MQKICAITRRPFEIEEIDLRFYKKIGVPSPTLCPDERARRRWATRPKNVYLRACGQCGKKAMAWYSPELTEVKTYCETCYRSDTFDATQYGRDFDFSQPFFPQFEQLLKAVPRHISNSIQNENSEYIISAHQNKDCYFVDEVDKSRDCYFGYSIQYCKNVVESLYVRDSEITYDVIEASDCYSVFYSQNVFNCANSAFLMNCRSVKNSLFCANLNNKEYHLFNQPVSKEEFEKSWKFIFSGSAENLQKCRDKFESFLQDQHFPEGTLVNNEDCTGNYIFNCKNVKDSYCVDNSRDCRFCSDIHRSNDCYDVNIYEGDLMYECTHVGPDGYGQFFSQLGWFSKNLQYCIEMNGCEDCFGCVGLKKKKYCLFNKQYSREAYYALRDRVIFHMNNTKEYGEFFPIEISQSPYNHTMAQRFFPLSKDEVLSRGWKWLDEPDYSQFKLTPQEIRFYDTHGIPHPTTSPYERIEALWQKMGLRKLFARQCGQCKKAIQTTFAPEAPYKVLCHACYLTIIS